MDVKDFGKLRTGGKKKPIGVNKAAALTLR
jgi:hypothetical protein